MPAKARTSLTPYCIITIRSMPSPKAKPLYLVRVVADAAQHVRMDHAGATHFQPAGVLADPAALAVADGAVDREIDARLDEREEVAAEADAPLRAEELPGHLGSVPLRSAIVMLRSTASPSS